MTINIVAVSHCNWGANPREFLASLNGPTIIRVPGRDHTRVRGVSTLIHGNEPSGLSAIYEWLQSGEIPAVDTLIFIGSVAAALAPPGFAHRFLPGHLDLNRCFLPPYGDTPEHQLAQALLDYLRQASVDALVDIHNNTGHNPSYSVASGVDIPRLGMAALFGTRYILSDLRLGSLTEATEDDFPSIAVECGRAGDPNADRVALRGLRAYLQLQTIDFTEVPRLEILEKPVRVSLRPQVSFAFATAPVANVSFTIDDNVDRHNFQELRPGQLIGWVYGLDWPIQAIGANGRDRSHELFVRNGNRLETAQPVIPIMMTTNTEIAKSDCLFYIVQRNDS